jgi:hypothetical protein
MEKVTQGFNENNIAVAASTHDEYKTNDALAALFDDETTPEADGAPGETLTHTATDSAMNQIATAPRTGNLFRDGEDKSKCFLSIPIYSVRVPSGRAPANKKRAKELRKSISLIGLLQPIVVTSDDHRLIAGSHRLEACRSLGWNEIPATVRDYDEIDAELAAIDENLVRKKLTKLEQAEQLARRKELYEAKYPGTKAGVAGGKARHGAAVDTPSFADDTAAQTGLSARSVRRIVEAAKLPEQVRDKIRETPVADKLSELKLLAGCDEETQATVAGKLEMGEVGSVKDAINSLGVGCAGQPVVEVVRAVKKTPATQFVTLIDKLLEVIFEIDVDGQLLGLVDGWDVQRRRDFICQLEDVCDTLTYYVRRIRRDGPPPPTASPPNGECDGGGDAGGGESDDFERESFEERAAAREYDCGLSREEAERLARWDLAHPKEPTLATFVRVNGGMRAGNSGLDGELRRLSNKETDSSRLVNNKSGKTITQMMNDANEEGYRARGGGRFEHPAEFLEAVELDATKRVRCYHPDTNLDWDKYRQ